MNFPEQVKARLWGDISVMAENPGRFAMNPDADFTRKRKMDFESLLRSIISMEGGSIKHELFKLFDFDPDTLTPSAFYQQRRKIHPDTFPFLAKQFLSYFPAKLYRGLYHLIASDGSEFYIPRNPLDPDSYYPSSGTSARGYNLLHVTALYDLMDRIYLDAIIQPGRKKNEYRAICDLMDRYDDRGGIPIFIADRGMSSYNSYAHAIENGLLFIIRTKDLNAMRLLGGEFSDFPDEFDSIVDRILTRTNAKSNRAQPEYEDCYRYIAQNAAFDFIDHNSKDEYSISLRVLRFKITDDSYENIVTNLPCDEFSVEDIKFLYGLRWNIESSFRDLKYVIGTVNFHSSSRALINQEIWARFILYNFCSIITARVVIEQKDTKYPYQVNYSMAIKFCHHFLRIAQGKDPPDILGLISRCTLPIRPGRRFHRHNRIRRPPTFLYRFS